MSAQNQRYYCRTKDLLWYRETKIAVEKVLHGDMTTADIRRESLDKNIFNASSTSRSKEIAQAVTRRVNAVDSAYLSFFVGRNTESQQLLCIVMVMLTDHTFLEFMDSVYREKLIQQDNILRDSDIMGLFHRIQEKDESAAKWTDASLRKVRDNYKSMLKEAGMLSESGTERKIIRPILDKEMENFLQSEGLIRIYKILAGERE
ncbi:MAG: DUF1819 family protein [Erysipelotrichaceae bacterium]|nr:DUF1819 family protein [Erysipelotrichaceae bacterium]MCH4045073.1 DUF1819 family protein [Erysipelotrichaceae bacterium]MCH4122284.1 DUF1819 family protein [Erysipelotrichaceae bacterium]